MAITIKIDGNLSTLTNPFKSLANVARGSVAHAKANAKDNYQALEAKGKAAHRQALLDKLAKLEEKLDV